MDFLQLSGKRFLIFGVANKKSVAYAVSKLLKEEGAECVFVVQNDAISERVKKLFPDSEIFTCDVEKEEDIKNLRTKVGEKYESFDGMLHSIAFADYSDGMKPFHETPRRAFLQALEISCFSQVSLIFSIKSFSSSVYLEKFTDTGGTR